MPTGATPFPFGDCRVCADKATGVHYGVATCEGCKGFFKRSIPKAGRYQCFFGGQCVLSPQNRNRCKACRFQRCVSVGMSIDAVKMGRIPKVDKERALAAHRDDCSDTLPDDAAPPSLAFTPFHSPKSLPPTHPPMPLQNASYLCQHRDFGSSAPLVPALPNQKQLSPESPASLMTSMEGFRTELEAAYPWGMQGSSNSSSREPSSEISIGDSCSSVAFPPNGDNFSSHLPKEESLPHQYTPPGESENLPESMLPSPPHAKPPHDSPPSAPTLYASNWHEGTPSNNKVKMEAQPDSTSSATFNPSVIRELINQVIENGQGKELQQTLLRQFFSSNKAAARSCEPGEEGFSEDSLLSELLMDGKKILEASNPLKRKYHQVADGIEACRPPAEDGSHGRDVSDDLFLLDLISAPPVSRFSNSYWHAENPSRVEGTHVSPNSEHYVLPSSSPLPAKPKDSSPVPQQPEEPTPPPFIQQPDLNTEPRPSCGNFLDNQENIQVDLQELDQYLYPQSKPTSTVNHYTGSCQEPVAPGPRSQYSSLNGIALASKKYLKFNVDIALEADKACVLASKLLLAAASFLETLDRNKQLMQEEQSGVKEVHPMNTVVRARKHQVLYMWDQLMDSIPVGNFDVLGLCRGTPLFNDLDPKDQAILMEEAYFDIWLTMNAVLFNKGDSYLRLPCDARYSRLWMHYFLPKTLVDDIFYYTEKINLLHLTQGEIITICTIQLTNPDHQGLLDPQKVYDIHQVYLSLLGYQLQESHHGNHAQTFDSILQLLPMLGPLNKAQAEIVGKFQVDSPPDGVLKYTIEDGGFVNKEFD